MKRCYILNKLEFYKLSIYLYLFTSFLILTPFIDIFLQFFLCSSIFLTILPHFEQYRFDVLIFEALLLFILDPTDILLLSVFLSFNGGFGLIFLFLIVLFIGNGISFISSTSLSFVFFNNASCLIDSSTI